MNILQVGLGNFGKRHLEAWHHLGLGDSLAVVAAIKAASFLESDGTLAAISR